MSEYTPITGELRAAMRQWGRVESDGSITFTSSSMPPSIDAEQSLAIIGSDFDRLCDAIDAVHAQLERENAALKAELDRVLGEQDNGTTKPPLLDMDGKPIHFGDVMVMDGDFEPCEVVGFYEEGFLAWRNGRYVPCTASLYRHHVPDTWERIIEDARTCTGSAGNYTSVPSMRWTNEVDALVARCKALCERPKEDA